MANAMSWHVEEQFFAVCLDKCTARQLDQVKPHFLSVCQRGTLLGCALTTAWPKDMEHVKSYILSVHRWTVFCSVP